MHALRPARRIQATTTDPTMASPRSLSNQSCGIVSRKPEHLGHKQGPCQTCLHGHMPTFRGHLRTHCSIAQSAQIAHCAISAKLALNLRRLLTQLEGQQLGLEGAALNPEQDGGLAQVILGHFEGPHHQVPLHLTKAVLES